MAKLSDFLGGLVSSISDARVNSDIQSLRIAEEYAKNDLLKHFVVPRMRVDKVELSIPIAVDEVIERNQVNYEPIDNRSFSSKTYQQILRSLDVDNLPNEVSKNLRSIISEHIQLLEARIRVNQIENALGEFSNTIGLNVIKVADQIFKDDNLRKTRKVDLTKLQDTLVKGLQETLKEEIKFKSENKILDSLHVIVEAHKLREVKPENVIMIKMTVSEQGMEWIKMENSEGEVVSKLMPE